MDAKLKRKWVKALTSGDFQQCESELWDGDNGYCCLGVLGVVAGLAHDDLRQGLLEDGYGHSILIDAGIQQELSDLNDASGDGVSLPDGNYVLTEGVPFDMIAGLIEEAL